MPYMVGSARPWSPTELAAGILVRYRHRELTGSDGSAISQWDDVSGNARHLLQATGANQPLAKTGANGIGGRTVARFDGSNDFLAATIAALNFERTDLFSLFAEIRISSLAADGLILARSENSVNFAGWYCGVLSTGKLSFWLQQDSAKFAQVRGATTLAINTPYAVAFCNSGAGTAAGMQIWLNGVQESLTTVSNNLDGTIQTASPSFTMGSRNLGGVRLAGDIGEGLVYGGMFSAAQNALLYTEYARGEFAMS